MTAGCASGPRYEYAPPVLGASTVRTGYAPYAVSRLSGLKAETEAEVILTTDPRIYHDCLKMTPAERVKWPACRGKLW